MIRIIGLKYKQRPKNIYRSHHLINDTFFISKKKNSLFNYNPTVTTLSD